MTKAEKTKQWIIEQAAPIFNKKGVAGTAMSDIMEATKLSKGSLYVHFEDKEALSYCAVDYTLDTFIKKAKAAFSHQKTGKAKLYSLIEFLSDPLSPPVIGGCPILNFGTEADDTNPVILDKVYKVIKGIQQTVAGIVEQGIKAGEFDKKWNSKEFAIKSFALIEGGVLISRVSGKSDQMKIIVKMIKNEIDSNTI
ncbi:TetR/AcrR family transcriptional regulator [Flavitalea sp.]|nr:TetR/AcrR family transcriptional regulator [Flavitalea sp.]